MPITSANFTVQNSNPHMTAQLNLALAYLQQSPTALAFLEMASQNGVQIGMNPKGTDHYPDVTGADPGRDLFDPGTHMVIWNPTSALEVKDGSGNIVGVQSAALGLLHEMVHSVDPAVMAHWFDRIPGYFNYAEYTAIQYENMVATDLGEVTRDSWRAHAVDADNPTTHTMPTESGLVWTQMNEQGVDEYGGHYDSPGRTPAGTVPEFGSTLEPFENSGGFEPAPEPFENSGGFGDPEPVADIGGWESGGDIDLGGGGSGSAGCVAVSSILPDGTLAGDIRVGAVMQLGDHETLTGSTGVVSYSQAKQAAGFRIVTESGASLVCSDTAPIPTKEHGLVTPAHLLGKEVAVRWDEAGKELASWEKIVAVEPRGIIYVQHITVGDQCFWAGEKSGAYILHHNSKDAGGSGGGVWDDRDGYFDPLTTGTPAGSAAALVAQAPPVVDTLFLM